MGLPILAQTCQVWYGLLQLGADLSNLMRTCPTWCRFVQLGADLSKFDTDLSNLVGEELSNLNAGLSDLVFLYTMVRTSLH